ncbi:membrane protein [Fructobacillus pseudoficulneus]|uniref:Membrane protein n=1 Tax=Fructobacillus pseudoficulneus TaxID=220714 RepID=A0A3F3H8D8_9LACO|nr:DUF1700 domain-containing protein [Fructobacillus pseudoficulneus]GAP02879.1 membrane protein [Fructobacillus pseudoficulneus]SEH45471.1 Uncharacterized membrane protein [Fructobacillus pseudoficulneus]
MSYLTKLEKELKGLPDQERNDILEYYREYLEDGGLSDQEASTTLGTPEELGEKVKNDYYTENGEQVPPYSQHTTAFKILITVLVVLSLPVTLPFFGGLFFTLFMLLFVFIILLLFATAAGVAFFIYGLFSIFHTFWSGMFFTGLGIFFIGLMLLAIPAILFVTRKVIRGVVELSRWLVRQWERI